MPKIIELTVQLEIQKVSCPGVWLCQDGRVSLTVFLLGTSYQTCMLPPLFPLTFKDVFYFRKRFPESCVLNNICCILKDETIYCELVQWSEDCNTTDCTVLAQYLGALNDVLFPSNMCMSDGVDLLMRRSKDFPGILSPKIEISTKVRIDEVWDQACLPRPQKVTSCHCTKPSDVARPRQVCHSAQYHRNKCNKRSPSASRNRSRSRSQGSTRSCSSINADPHIKSCWCQKHDGSTSPSKSRQSISQSSRHAPRNKRQNKCQYSVYNLQTIVGSQLPKDGIPQDYSDIEDTARHHQENDKYETGPISVLSDEDRIQKLLLESKYIDQEPIYQSKLKQRETSYHMKTRITPCVCEICRKYHELFHTNETKS